MRPRTPNASVLALLALLPATSVCPHDLPQSGWRARTVFRPEGAPFQEVRDLIEDHEGGVWVATWGEGVTRIRGTTWRTLDHSSGLPGDWVRCLLRGRDGWVWIGTADGLCRVRDERIEVFTTENTSSLPDNSIRALERVDESTIWVGAGDELCRVLALDETAPGLAESWRPIAEVPGRVRDIARTPAGSWIALGKTGLVRLEGDRAVIELRGPVWRLLVVDGALHAACDESILVRDDSRWRPVRRFDGSVLTLASRSDGVLFAGTSDGVFMRQRGVWSPIDLGRRDTVKSILVADGGDVVWFGSLRGLSRGSRYPWTATQTETGAALVASTFVPRKTAPPLCLDTAGNLLHFVDGRWKVLFPLDGGRGAHVSAMHSGGLLWILSRDQLRCVSVAERRVVDRIEVLPRGAPRHLLEASSGAIWLATSAGVYALEQGSGRWRVVGEPLPFDCYYVEVAESRDGDFFVGYSDFERGGLMRIEAGEVEDLADRHPELRDVKVITVCPASDGRLWIGTDGEGVIVIDGDSLRRFTRADGLTSRLIARMWEASDGSMWLGYRRKGVGTYRGGRWVNFSDRHGLPTVSIQRFGEYPAGTIWLAANSREQWKSLREDGVYSYRPEREPPETFIDAVPHALSSHGIGVFSFSSLDAWNDTAPQDLAYSFRIRPVDEAGHDSDWSPFSAKTSIVTDKRPLRPGEYVFEVRAVDLHDNVDPTPATARFAVQQPLYARVEFVLPIVLLGLSTLVMLVLWWVRHHQLRRSEENLRGANARLSEEIAVRRSAEEEKARLQERLYLSQKMEAVGTLAAGVAHDFNNTLTAVKGFSDFARDASSRGQLEESLRSIDDAVEQGKGVTRALLTFSRKGRGRKSPQNLARLIEESLRLLETAMPASIEVTSDLRSGEDLWVRADSTRLKQAILNLALNARDAMGDGGTLRISLRGEDRNGASSASRVAVLEVEDTGRGIAEDVRDRVFEPFFTTKERGRGTGLGLSIVHGTVTDHGGRVELESEPGRGTLVRIELPTCPAPEDDHAASGAGEDFGDTAEVDGSGLVVLLAEDERQIRTLFASALETAGCTVFAVADGRSAYDVFAARRDEIDVAVLDIDLPVRSGLDCLRGFQEARPGLPAVLVSGLPCDDVERSNLDNVTFMQKPTAPSELIAAVRRAAAAGAPRTA